MSVDVDVCFYNKLDNPLKVAISFGFIFDWIIFILIIKL